MDQLQTALNVLKRYHFWALSVIVIAVAVGCWYSASGALASKFQANRLKIESEFRNQDNLARGQSHANEDINERQAAEIRKEAAHVQQTWEMLYKRQRDEVLHWPEEFDETFHKGVESLKFGEDISRDLRDQYFTYIKNHFPKLPAIVGAKVAEGERASRRGDDSFGAHVPGGPDDQEADDDKYLVDWQDQAHVRDGLQWASCPSAWEIWKVQEDLWVYHALLQIIADTNEGADRRSNAAVRVIMSLEVGQAAAAASDSTGRIMVPQVAAGGRGSGGEFGGMEPGMVSGAGPGFGERPSHGGGGATEGSGGDECERLLSRRYLDKSGKPIEVRGRVADPKQFGVEFKRLPVLMVLEMDQREIPRLIANCTNQPLQVEVQQVRINPSDARVGASRRAKVDTRSGAETFDSQTNIATVVIHGVIYIINQPDTSTLQIAGT
jgi:hypothetical protein